MSMFTWFNKILGIDDSKSKNDLPSEFRLPTEYSNIDGRVQNFEHNEINDPFVVDFGGMVRKMFRGLQIPNDNSNSEDNVNFNENEEYYNGVPQRNVMARNNFLSTPSVKPATSYKITPEFEQVASKKYSRCIGHWHGRRIEKETTVRQLSDGITEEVIVLTDGNQKCIKTITENTRTGKQKCNEQLINLDKRQLYEFEHRFRGLGGDLNFMLENWVDL